MGSALSLIVLACGAPDGAHSAAPSGLPPRSSERAPGAAFESATAGDAIAVPIVAERRDGEVVEIWEGTFGAGRDLSLSLVLAEGECYRIRVVAPGGALFGTLDDEHGHRLASARGEGGIDLCASGLCPRWTGSFVLEVDGPGALRRALVELVRLPEPSGLSPRLPSEPSDEAPPEGASGP